MTTASPRQYLDESLDAHRQARRRQHRGAWPTGLARVRAGGGRLFILGVGGSAGPRRPRGQRLPQALRLRGVRADRQRQRAHRARERRGLGHLLLRVAARARACARATASSSSRVGGGNREKNVSVNLVRSLELAREVGAKIFGIVGRDGGFTKQVADACVVIPTVAAERVDAAHRGLRRGRLAPARQPPEAAARRDEVGEREVTEVAILDRDGTIIDVVRDEETGAITVAFHPRSHPPAAGRRRGHARARGRRLRARDRDESARRRRRGSSRPTPCGGRTTRSSTRLAGEGVAIAAVEACMHHPEGGPGGDAVARRPVRLPQAQGAGMLDAHRRRGSAPIAARSWMIGDCAERRRRPARAAGLRAGLVFATNRCELCPLRGGPAGSCPTRTARHWRSSQEPSCAAAD